MGRQVGSFFLFVGALVAFVFAASYQIGSPEYTYCLIGLSLISLGAFMIYKSQRKPHEAERFRLIKKMRDRKKK